MGQRVGASWILQDLNWAKIAQAGAITVGDSLDRSGSEVVLIRLLVHDLLCLLRLVHDDSQ